MNVDGFAKFLCWCPVGDFIVSPIINTVHKYSKNIFLAIAFWLLKHLLYMLLKSHRLRSIIELKTAPVGLMWTKYPYVLHGPSAELVPHADTVSTCGKFTRACVNTAGNKECSSVSAYADLFMSIPSYC